MGRRQQLGKRRLVTIPQLPGQAADATINFAATGRGGSATPLASFLGINQIGAGAAVSAETISGANREGGVSFRLMQNSPNPVFSRTGTTIQFSLSQEGDVDLQVFDVAGRSPAAKKRRSDAPTTCRTS